MAARGGARPPKVPKIEISVTKGDKTFTLQMRPYKTMRQMKMKLYLMTEVPIRQMLICLDRNKLLDAGDNIKLKDHGIKAGARLYMGHKESSGSDHHVCP